MSDKKTGSDLPKPPLRHGSYRPDDDWKLRNVKDGKPIYDPQKLLPAPRNNSNIQTIAPDFEDIFNDQEAAKRIKQSLKVEDLSIKQIQFAMFLALPEEHRPTCKRMSELISVSVRTVFYWQDDNRIQDLKMEIWRVYARRSAPDVLRAVNEQAKRGNIKAAKLLFEIYGVIDQNKQPQVQNNFILLSNEQINEKLAHLEKLEQIARVRANEIPVESGEVADRPGPAAD